MSETVKKEIKNHDLKPMDYSEAMKIQKGIKATTVSVERADGKKIVIATQTLASHLERGFKLVGKAAAVVAPVSTASTDGATLGEGAQVPATPAPAPTKAPAKKVAKKAPAK